MLFRMVGSNNLRATALFTLLLATEAMYTEPMKAAKRDLKSVVHKTLQELRKEPIFKHKEHTGVHTVGRLSDLRNNTVGNNSSDCELVSIFHFYFTEASDLDIQTQVTEQLQEINQNLQYFQKELCQTEPDVKHHGTAFKKSDGDYEKLCSVVNLLKHLLKWLSR